MLRDPWREAGLGLADGAEMSGANEPVDRFFDSLSDDYTAVIERCFPRYREMLWALLYYLPDTANEPAIVELGAGTGNLSVLLRAMFPKGSLRLVDISDESLAACRRRFESDARTEFISADFRDLVFDNDSIDLLLSSISIHHLTAIEKRRLFQRAFQWLRPGGVFSFCDQCAGRSPWVYQRHIDQWREQSEAAGASPDEWEMWMRHQRDHDHHDTLVDQLDWLREEGFADVDCTWRYLLWSVIQCRKPAS